MLLQDLLNELEQQPLGFIIVPPDSVTQHRPKRGTYAQAGQREGRSGDGTRQLAPFEQESVQTMGSSGERGVNRSRPRRQAPSAINYARFSSGLSHIYDGVGGSRKDDEPPSVMSGHEWPQLLLTVKEKGSCTPHTHAHSSCLSTRDDPIFANIQIVIARIAFFSSRKVTC